jgi:hypothetical protein
MRVVESTFLVKKTIETEEQIRPRAVMKMSRDYRLWLSVGATAISLFVVLVLARAHATDGRWSHDEIGFQHKARSGHTEGVYEGDAAALNPGNSVCRTEEKLLGFTFLQEDQGLREELKVKLRRGGPNDLGVRNGGNTLRESKSLFADKGGVVSYKKRILNGKLVLEDAYRPYPVTYNSTGRVRQGDGDTGLLVRY